MEEQTMLFQMLVLDYFILANDPTEESLSKIRARAEKLGQVEWLKENFTNYFK